MIVAPQRTHGSPARRCTRKRSWNEPLGAVRVAEVVDRRAARVDAGLEDLDHRRAQLLDLLAP